MSVLGELSRRLKTDLADTQRAIIDPNFAMLQAQDQFKEKELKREEEQWLKRYQMKKRDDAALQEQQNKFRLQEYHAMKAFDNAAFTGRYYELAPLLDDPNLEQPIKDFLGSAMRQKGVTPEGVKFQHKTLQDAFNNNLNQQKFLEQIHQFDTKEQNILMRHYDDMANEQLKRVDELMKQTQESNLEAADVRSARNFFLNLPKDDPLRSKYLAMLAADNSREGVFKAYSMYMDEIKDQQAMARAKVRDRQEREDRDSATNPEIFKAIDFLDAESEKGEQSRFQKNAEAYSDLSEPDKRAYQNYVADLAKKLDKDPRFKLTYAQALELATESAERGLVDSDNFWTWQPDYTFDPTLTRE